MLIQHQYYPLTVFHYPRAPYRWTADTSLWTVDIGPSPYILNFVPSTTMGPKKGSGKNGNPKKSKEKISSDNNEQHDGSSQSAPSVAPATSATTVAASSPTLTVDMIIEAAAGFSPAPFQSTASASIDSDTSPLGGSGASFIELTVSNLSCHVTVDNIIELFGLHKTTYLQTSCKVEMNDSDGAYWATLLVPDFAALEILKLDGTVEFGRTINIRKGDTPSQHPHDQSGGSYASITGRSSVGSAFRYVELDTTACYSCYGVPTKSVVLHALKISYGRDPTKKPKALGGHNAGVWRIETDNVQMYENTPFLMYNGKNIGSLCIKEEERVVEADGRITVKRSTTDELLITLFNANTEMFRDVTDEMLVEKIVSMDVGTMKKGPTPQLHPGSDVMNGNKYFVLQNIKKDQYDKIFNCFDFLDSQSRSLPRMWLNFRGKKRKCFFCGNIHADACKLQELARKLEREREEVKVKHQGLPIKTYSDSTLRYARSASLASDVDAMSGATMGNLLNAVGIDADSQHVPNLVFVSGRNELNPNLSPEEFLHVLQNRDERLLSLAKDKKIIVISPAQNALSAIDKVKEDVLRVRSEALESHHNIKVFINPIQRFEEDGGLHPSPKQTAAILHFIDDKTKDFFGNQYILPSVDTDDILVTDRKYAGVCPLYKYGCGACADKSRNKWYSICSACKDSIRSDESLRRHVADLMLTAARVEEEENPALGAANIRKRDHDGLLNVDINETTSTPDGGKRSRRSVILHEK